MHAFFRELAEQRWDDHRYYHQHRVNQSLHFFSACCFLASYGLLFVSPAAAVLLGWLVAWVSRQLGHFFFEPQGFDAVNGVTYDYKESVKVGYNIQRKIVLLAVWLSSPVLLWLSPSLWGLVNPHSDAVTLLNNVGLLWLFVAAGALLFRTVQLFVVRDVRTGLAWFVKILTDPLHDIRLYYKAPVYVLRGELLDPIHAEAPQQV